jgi:hypothetical protein
MNKYALKSGNWDDADMWGDSPAGPATLPPGVDDVAFANAFNININVNVTCKDITNDSGNGTFTLSNNVTLNANVVAKATTAIACVTLSGSNSAVINGNIENWAVVASNQAVLMTSSGTLQINGTIHYVTDFDSGLNVVRKTGSMGTLTINGDVLSAYGIFSPSLVHAGSANSLVVINGNVEGSTANSSLSTILNSGGNIIVNGDLIQPPTDNNASGANAIEISSGNLTINGNIIGGNTMQRQVTIKSSGTCAVNGNIIGRVIFNDTAVPVAINGNLLMNNSALFGTKERGFISGPFSITSTSRVFLAINGKPVEFFETAPSDYFSAEYVGNKLAGEVNA